MTQKQLRKALREVIRLHHDTYHPNGKMDSSTYERRVLGIINQHVVEVIGENARNTPRTERDNLVKTVTNNIKAEQRQRAGLTKEAPGA